MPADRFGFWESLYLCFFSKALYQNVYSKWVGVAARHLFVVVFIATIINIAHTQYYLHTTPEQEIIKTMELTAPGDIASPSTTDSSTPTKEVHLSKDFPRIVMIGQALSSLATYFVLLILGAIMAGVVTLLSRKRSFKPLMRLAIVAMVPAIIVNMVLSNVLFMAFDGGHIPYLQVISFMIIFGFYTYGMHVTKGTS